MKTQARLARADVRAEANRLTDAGWDLELNAATSHVHVYCPACGTRVTGLPSTPSRSGRWRVRARTTTKTHASRCWVDRGEE